MSIYIKSITVSKILDLIEQFLSEAEQHWLNQQLTQRLTKRSLSLAQKRTLVDELCGSWADDQSLKPIFEEVEQQRALSQTREVVFDF